MSKAYIILAHKNALQVNRLIEKLDDNKSFFFLHVDLKADISPFKQEFKNKNNVVFVKRVVSNWAGFGIITAITNSFKAIQTHGRHFERIILLSGQHYPIKSNEYINNFFLTSPSSIFLEYFIMPHQPWQPGGGMFRFTKYYFGATFIKKYLAKSANFLGRYVFALNRQVPIGIKPYGGSCWWILDSQALYYIIDYLDKNPWYAKYHRWTFAADEVFFQTILLNSTDQSLLSSIENDDKTFLNWSDRSNPHPDLLTTMHINKIAACDDLFARKFDDRVDKQVLNMIDEYSLS